MVILKQNYIPSTNQQNITSFSQSHPLTCKEEVKQSLKKFNTGNKKNFTKVQMEQTLHGFACVGFDVFKWRCDLSSNPIRKTVQLRYDYITHKIEITLQHIGPNELKKAYVMQGHEGRKVFVISKDSYYVLEFVSMYKVAQFMQLYQIFKVISKINYDYNP